MKRFVTTLIMVYCCCLAAITINAQNGSDQVVVFEIEKDHIDTPIYRAPAIVPVQGYYVSFINTLYLSFIYDMGNVTVTIENIVTGESLSESIPTESGLQAIPLGANNGLYVITIIVPGGQQYTAELLI